MLPNPYQIQSDQQKKLFAALQNYPQLVLRPGNPPIEFELMGQLELQIGENQDKLCVRSTGVRQMLSIKWSELRLAQLDDTQSSLLLSNGQNLILGVQNPDGDLAELRALTGLMQDLPRPLATEVLLDLQQGWHMTDIRPGDRGAYLLHLNNPAIYRYTLHIPYPYTAQDADQWLALVDVLYQARQLPSNLAIRNPDGALCGGIGLLLSPDPHLPHQAEIGYWLAEPFWGQGVMTTAVRKFCNWAFTHYGFTRLTAHIFRENIASEQVLHKCGFQLEGSMTHHYLKDGVLYDGKLYALTRA